VWSLNNEGLGINSNGIGLTCW